MQGNNVPPQKRPHLNVLRQKMVDKRKRISQTIFFYGDMRYEIVFF